MSWFQTYLLLLQFLPVFIQDCCCAILQASIYSILSVCILSVSLIVNCFAPFERLPLFKCLSATVVVKVQDTGKITIRPGRCGRQIYQKSGQMHHKWHYRDGSIMNEIYKYVFLQVSMKTIKGADVQRDRNTRSQ